MKYDVGTMINGILGSLVSVTAICTLVTPWEALLIGLVGALLCCMTDFVMLKLKIDDPVGVVAVHGVCGIWGLLTVGLFLEEEQASVPGQAGLFKTGQFYMLGVQTLTAVSIIVWTVICSYICLKIIDKTIGLRLSEEHEIIGCDLLEHGVTHGYSFTPIAEDAQRLEHGVSRVYSLSPIAEAAQRLEEVTTNGNTNNTEEFQHRLKIL